MTETPGTGGTGLQFDRAEYAAAPGAMTCGNCQQPIAVTYYEANGKTLCERCKFMAAEFLSSTPGGSGFLKATMAGLGAALLGALVYYLVLVWTERIFGLIAVLVGYMVGKAVRWGTGNRGGARYQALAILLTYFAIVSAFAPILVRGIREAAVEQQAQQTASNAAGTAKAGAVSTAATGAPAVDKTPPTAGRVLMAFGFLGLVLLASPFLGGFDPIGWAIIAFGLYEAWKLNKRVSFEIHGPFTAGAVRPS